MYRSPISDSQGPRGEFLKCLAELGENPAFIQRAQRVDEAWVQLLERCRTERAAMLRWPWMHLSILADRLKHDWSALAQYLADECQGSHFENLYKEWKGLFESKTISGNSWTSTRRILGDFVGSVARFNRTWSKFIEDVNLEEVNRLRRDYNQHYPVEKSCAFDCEDVERLGFTPLVPSRWSISRQHFRRLQFPDFAIISAERPRPSF
jgi:hypothetical protein